MRRIKKFSDEHIVQFIDIAANAYPVFGFNTPERKEKLIERVIEVNNNDESINYYGIFDDDKVVGGMRMHDYTMNVFDHLLPVGGVGMIAVDLTRKKEKFARDMIAFFLDHYNSQEACFVILYPFRPDFYRRMGFGYGPQIHRFRFKPSDLPISNLKSKIALTTDQDAIEACYNRVQIRTHGLIKKTRADLAAIFRRPNNRVVAYYEDNEIRGYFVFHSKGTVEGNPIQQDMIITEFFYENTIAFLSLLDFIRRQSDQVDRVEFITQDEYFYYVSSDPRDDSNLMIPEVNYATNLSGLGIMYRVLDVARVFSMLSAHQFGSTNYILKLSIRDSFMQNNNKSFTINFMKGLATFPKSQNQAVDVEVTMDIADFSSLLLGIIDFKHLLTYGLAEISDETFVDTVQKTFYSQVKPRCKTEF
jgi:predicted acetyltransferase